MIKKRLKNLSKLTLLIGVRQGYFLVRNWYLLITQPYLTIKSIYETKDKSQFSLIAVTALAPIWVYMAGRIIYDLYKYHRMIGTTGNVLIATGGLQVLVLGYLGYWTLKVLKNE